jgi:hypothetical protein
MLFVYIPKEQAKFSANVACDFIQITYLRRSVISLQEYVKLLEYIKLSHKEVSQARHWWLTPVILFSQEARRPGA